MSAQSITRSSGVGVIYHIGPFPWCAVRSRVKCIIVYHFTNWTNGLCVINGADVRWIHCKLERPCWWARAFWKGVWSREYVVRGKNDSRNNAYLPAIYGGNIEVNMVDAVDLDGRYGMKRWCGTNSWTNHFCFAYLNNVTSPTLLWEIQRINRYNTQTHCAHTIPHHTRHVPWEKGLDMTPVYTLWGRGRCVR